MNQCKTVTSAGRVGHGLGKISCSFSGMREGQLEDFGNEHNESRADMEHDDTFLETTHDCCCLAPGASGKPCSGFSCTLSRCCGHYETCGVQFS